MINTIDRTLQFQPLNVAVLTISDTRSRADDKSGDYLEKEITAAGHILTARAIVRDEIAAIRQQIKRWTVELPLHAIITTGGTGFTGRDVTPEALEPLFDKKMDGFSYLFHKISFETIGIVTMQSRATAGLIGETFVFCLPGSTGACRDAWCNILKGEFDSRQLPNNLVQLLPRLTER